MTLITSCGRFERKEDDYLFEMQTCGCKWKGLVEAFQRKTVLVAVPKTVIFYTKVVDGKKNLKGSSELYGSTSFWWP